MTTPPLNPPGNPAWTRKWPRNGAGVHRRRPPGASLASEAPDLRVFSLVAAELGFATRQETSGGLAVPQVEAARLQAAEVAAAEAACCS